MSILQEKTVTPDMTIRPKKHPAKTILLGAVICLGLVVGGLIALNTFFSQPSPQQAIQTLLEERASALGRKDLAQYLLCFSPQYQNGDQGYEDLKTNASRWFAQFETIQFTFQTLRLEIDDAQAFVENNYRFNLRPADGDMRSISSRELLELRREKTGWKIFKNLKPQ